MSVPRETLTFWQIFRARQRLYVAIACGVAVACFIPLQVGAMSRAVIGWDCGVSLYLALMLHTAARATPASMRRRAQFEDATRWIFLALMSGAAWFSMFALLDILHEVRATSGLQSVELTILAGATILLSWLFAHTAFAVHYAHDYYADPAASRSPGLMFPGGHGDPDYWDFLYFSFVIGMTCQVSDVQVTTRSWRRLVLTHGVISFLFNTVILALSINLLAGLL